MCCYVYLYMYVVVNSNAYTCVLLTPNEDKILFLIEILCLLNLIGGS